MPRATFRTFQVFITMSLVLVLAACGGGDDDSSTIPMPEPPIEQPEPQPEPDPEPNPQPDPEPELEASWQMSPQAFHEDSVEQPCQFAHIAGACGDDGTPRRIAGLALQGPSDHQQAPVYYHNGYLYVGAEIAQQSGVDALATFGPVDETIIRHGQITDGAGRDALVGFLQAVTDGTVTWPSPPAVVKLAADTSDEHVNYALKAVQLVNSALPDEYRLRVSADAAPVRSATVPDGEVYIDFAPRSEWVGATASQTAVGHTSYLSPTASHIWIQHDYERQGEAKMLSLLVHELMHTFRLNHPDPAREKTRSSSQISTRRPRIRNSPRICCGRWTAKGCLPSTRASMLAILRPALAHGMLTHGTSLASFQAWHLACEYATDMPSLGHRDSRGSEVTTWGTTRICQAPPHGQGTWSASLRPLSL